ncbi:MAG: undecaprenyl-diphosphate phosphatase [Gammaproteobacteria bacterium]|nr:undecaprenyl-diphosphate phosphatase [Gammaproteobacteria bacterium]MBP9728994.1 undecaprenyl-diphosphate phosphatase [Gammaproteobacteria bacterium]
MLENLQICVLAIVQGLTEFLPVSSSAHLILMPKLFGWVDQGLAFDIAVHVGTLFAVLLYFRQDLLSLCKHGVGVLIGQPMNTKAKTESKIAWSIVLATIPVGLCGLAFKGLIETHLRSPLVIAYSTLGFGLLLWVADRLGAKQRTFKRFRWGDAVAIGLGQALALIPGTSRSGVTLTVGLMLGLTPEFAARFSFLLSIPVIVLAAGLEVINLYKQGGLIDWQPLMIGACIAGLSGYACIHYFLKLLNRVGLFPFVCYRLCLGTALLYCYGNH